MTFLPPEAVPPARPVNPSRAVDDPEYTILIGEAPEAPAGFRFPLLKCNPDGHLRIARAPNSPVTFSKFTAADGTSTPKQLDIGFLGFNRDMVTIVNTSDKDVFVNLGFTVSQTMVSRILGPYSSNDPTKTAACQWVIPVSNPFYGGALWGMWPSPTTTGGIICTELT